jgi:hypothetical protein
MAKPAPSLCFSIKRNMNAAWTFAYGYSF